MQLAFPVERVPDIVMDKSFMAFLRIWEHAERVERKYKLGSSIAASMLEQIGLLSADDNFDPFFSRIPVVTS
eukprot:6180437-Pleurochrysis_carterae.AAC.8